MRAYVVRRLLLAVVTVFLVSIIVFLMVRLIPGNIVDALIAQQMQIGETSDHREIEAARATIEKQLGLDRPILQQYAEWIARAVQGDLGNSLWRHTPVIEDIAIRWPVTLELGILGLIIDQLIAIPIGIYSAQRQDTVTDYAARSFAIGLVALPGFWVATLVIVFPSIWWGYQPPITYVRFFEDPLANLQMFLVAAAVLGMSMSGGTMRMMRTTMLEVLRQDYVRTAWSKGLKEETVGMRGHSVTPETMQPVRKVRPPDTISDESGYTVRWKIHASQARVSAAKMRRKPAAEMAAAVHCQSVAAQ